MIALLTHSVKEALRTWSLECKRAHQAFEGEEGVQSQEDVLRLE